MIKQKLKYVDFDDEIKEENLYFNLTAMEIADIEIELGTDVEKYINSIISKDSEGKPFILPENNQKVWNLFKMIISKAYGERTTEGRFVKNEQIRDAFLATEAYSQLFLRLLKDPDAAKMFFTELTKVKTGTIPEDHKESNDKN